MRRDEKDAWRKGMNRRKQYLLELGEPSRTGKEIENIKEDCY
jgi:hypothetical protein